MRQILHTYKLRLTNLSQRNRSLRLSRLSSRRDIDLTQITPIHNESPQDLFKKVLAGKTFPLLKKLDPRFHQANVVDRRLNNIYREINTIFEETGSYDLYIGYLFVQGRFLNANTLRAPLILFPVRLVRNLKSRPRWVLQVNPDESVQFNRTFFLALEQFQQLRVKETFWEEELEHHKDWQEWLNELFELFKTYELDQTLAFDPNIIRQEIAPFQDMTVKEMQAFPLGALKVLPHAVLGIFPQSDSALLKDYEAIERQPDLFKLDKYFKPQDPTLEPISESYIPEEHRYFVTKVDQSQEETILKVKQKKDVVIHGPPGTGKSQVIVNIIADAMAHGKKVLLISQKRVALDVVYKRLHALGLNRFACLVHDYQRDRKTIFQKIKRQIDDIASFKSELNSLTLTQFERAYKQFARQADQAHKEFEQLYELLTKPQRHGLNMHYLYLHTDPKPELKYPIQELSPSWNITLLEEFIPKLEAILDYPEFFEPTYPWHHRLSFRHYTSLDQERLNEKLIQIAPKLQRIHQQYSQLKDLKGNLLHLPTLRKYIKIYKEAQDILNNHTQRKDLEAIRKNELAPEFISRKLTELEAIFSEMECLQILKGIQWNAFLSLKDHVAAYDTAPTGFSRYFSLSYHQASWAIGATLENYGYEFTPYNYALFKQDMSILNQLFLHYAQWHDLLFFKDFPIHGTLKDKRAWHSQKQASLVASQLIQSIEDLPSIKPVFTYGELNNERWKNTQKTITALETFETKLSATFQSWESFLHPTQIAPLKKGIIDLAESKPYIQKLTESFNQDFHELKGLDTLLANLESHEAELLLHLTPFIQADVTPEAFIKILCNSFHIYWIEQTERANPILIELGTRAFPRKHQAYHKHLSQKRAKVSELIQRRIKEGICSIITYNRLKNPVTYRRILHQVSKQRRLWSVRKLVSETWNEGLSQLMPCWMASPESAAAIFPMQPDFFDLVIFDEASQCFVERAIPILLRSKQLVIAGDEQQLEPFDLYTVKYDDSEMEFVEDETALEVKSLLDFAKTTFSRQHLLWHYRSKSEALIDFSNHAFYEGKLQIMPFAKPDIQNHPPLEWIQVEGEWRQNRNVQEAERVTKLIIELIQRPNQPSIGIVTFNYHQQELIRDQIDRLLESFAEDNDPKYELLQAALTKTENEEFMGLFVKNIENVQGDERDIIIFSVAYAKNDAGKLVTRFGLLNQLGGEKRLNVAITRAKEKVYVIASFDPNELNVANSRHLGPKRFKEYLQYVKAVSNDRGEEAFEHLTPSSPEDSPRPTQLPNPIAEQTAAYLRTQGYYVIENLGHTQFKIDLAVKESVDSEEFLLAIECEGSHYFSGATPKEREVYRPQLLHSRGWKTYRIWARNFMYNPQKEWDNILKLLPPNKSE